MFSLTGRLIFLTYWLSHEPGALGIIIYPLREVYASLNLVRKRLFYNKRNLSLSYAWLGKLKQRLRFR